MFLQHISITRLFWQAVTIMTFTLLTLTRSIIAGTRHYLSGRAMVRTPVRSTLIHCLMQTAAWFPQAISWIIRARPLQASRMICTAVTALRPHRIWVPSSFRSQDRTWQEATPLEAVAIMIPFLRPWMIFLFTVSPDRLSLIFLPVSIMIQLCWARCMVRQR